MRTNQPSPAIVHAEAYAADHVASKSKTVRKDSKSTYRKADKIRAKRCVLGELLRRKQPRLRDRPQIAMNVV